MIETGIEFVSLDRVDKGLDRLEKELESLRPLWDRFGEEFYSEETGWFARAPFAPLSPAYAKRKAEKFGSRPILQATGQLIGSLTQKGAPMNVHRASNFGFEVGTRDFKAMFHQEGTSRMPARPPLAEPDDERYGTIAGQYVDELIRKAGFN